MSNPLLLNDRVLYRLEIDYDDDFYADVFVYASDADAATEHSSVSPKNNHLDITAIQVHEIFDLRVLNEEHLNELLRFSMAEPKTFQHIGLK